MNDHKPYTNDQHWKAFWRVFYSQKKAGNIIEIDITEKMRDEAKNFSQSIIKEKMKEKVHQRDPKNEWKRWMTGVLGEIALESFLHTTFRDTTIGNSKKYNVPDLADIHLKLGVKSFRVGNFPLMNRSKKTYKQERTPMYGQVFIGISQDLKKAFLFGVAFDEQLHKNELNPNNDRFVKDFNALKRKVAFTNLENLHIFQNLSELKELATEHDCILAPSDSNVVA